MGSIIFLCGLILLVFLWIPFLFLGIKRLKQGYKGSGLFFTIVSGLWGLAAIPLSIMLVIGALIYYSAKNFETKNFDAAEYKGETGICAIAWNKKAEAVFTKGNERLRFKTANGQFKMPVGDWKSRNFILYDVAGDKRIWNMAVYISKKIKIVPNKKENLDIGGELKAKIDVKHAAGRMINLALVLSDNFNNRVSVWGGSRREKTGFQLLNKNGEAVFQGNFKYG